MISRILGILFAVGLLATGGWLLYRYFIQTGTQEEVPIPTVTVSRSDVSEVVHCVGEVEPSLFTDLKAEVSGRIDHIHQLEGSRVERDDLILELDRKELETQIEEANHRIEAARLRAAKVKLDYDSKLDLSKKGFVSEREFSEAEIDFKLAENDLAIQQSQLAQLKEQLEKTRITAPHAGILLDHDLTEGMVITGITSFNEGSVLMRVAQLDELQVETEISEVDVSKVERDMEVTLAFDSLPDVTITGEITFISPSARAREGGSANSKARVFPITVAFVAGEHSVRPGMTAQVKITVAEATQTLAAGLPGLFMEEGQSVVYVKTGDDEFERREVEVGINNNSLVEILTGVEEGDELATVQPPEDEEEGDETVASSGRY